VRAALDTRLDQQCDNSLGRDRQPVVVEAGILHADQETGLFDIDETLFPPGVRHFVGRAQRAKEPPLERWIEHRRDILHHPCRGHSAVGIPYRARHGPTGPHDTAHLGNGTQGVRNELHDQHGERSIERGITKRQRAGIALMKSDARVSVAGVRTADKGFGLIDAGNGSDVADRRNAKVRLPVPQPTSNTRSPSVTPPNRISIGAKRRLQRPMACS